MSDAISRQIKQLETQNAKFRKLLEATRQITSEEATKCLQLKSEAKFLKKVVSDLENQKKQLENELKTCLIQDGCSLGANADVDIQTKLNNTLNDIQRESAEILQMEIADEYFHNVILDLEKEKEILLQDIISVKKADEESKMLAKENLQLKQELALLESKCPANVSPSSCSSQDLVKKLASIENMQQNLQDDINTAKQSRDLLGIPTENAVLELKICGLEKQKEIILSNLRAKLLQAANEISMLHSDTSDDQLRRLLNELDIHKSILMMNLNDLKDLHEKFNDDAMSDSDSSEIIQKVTERSEDIYDLPTVSEEDEIQNDLLVEKERLINGLNRLELERAELLEQVENANAQLLMKDDSPEDAHKLSLDDATNQLYINQEQLLVQRIRELEDDNEKTRGELRALMEEARSDQDDLEILEEGERLIKELK